MATLSAQALQVGENGRRLVKDDGKPFFYLADTAWELIHRCDRQETELYLKDRREKGFTVVQTVVLAELDGLNTPSACGERPLIGNDPLKPNEAYFKHVDWVVEKAAELNLVVALLPTWGDKWNKRWGKGPVIFDTPEKAERYGEWIGKRYKKHPNIIWVLGGDRSPETPDHYKIIRAMAKGLKNGDEGRHLITFHPSGGKSSSQWFHNEDWLDFNMMQTGHHRRHRPVYENIGRDYGLQPAKPCLNGEPQYEDILVGFKTNNARFSDYDAREAAWWSVLSGACGHTYGNSNIWQMYKPGRAPVLHARIPWEHALYQPGAMQMGYMRKVFESRPFLSLVPDQTVLVGNGGKESRNTRVARDQNGSYIIAYLPLGNAVDLKLQKLKADRINGYWYNPREGISEKIKPFNNPKTVMGFKPPSHGEATDWVLILDDEAKQYPDPARFDWNSDGTGG